MIWGFRSEKHDYAEVGFPQDLRNCTVCHSGANPKTPQGDNWKTRPTKESCLTCHANNPGSAWDAAHTDYALVIVGPSGKPKDIPNGSCAECHRAGKAVSPERVHFNQNEENAAKYKVNIESATFNAGARKVTVTYFLSDPTNNNARYNLITPDCTFPAPNVCAPPSGTNNTQFGNLRFYLAYQNLVGQPTAITEFTAYNNGGSSANAYLYRGTNNGTNKYMVDIPLPADSATAVAQGTARIVGVGQVKEQKLEVKSAADPRPPVTPTEFVSVVVQHTFADVVLSGALNPRRQVVANEKCNVCHGALGTTTGSNTKANAFHGGARNTVEVCVLCHDQNRFSSTVMTNGLALSENYSFKRMIHGIHGSSKRNQPFTHDNAVIGAFGKDGLLGGAGGFTSGSSSAAPLGTPAIPFATTTAVPAGTPLGSDVTNYAAEVAYPALGLNCDGCHVNGSWRVDRGPIGSVVAKPLLGSATPLTVETDPLKWLVITPKAATCTACHDSTNAMSHVVGSRRRVIRQRDAGAVVPDAGDLRRLPRTGASARSRHRARTEVGRAAPGAAQAARSSASEDSGGGSDANKKRVGGCPCNPARLGGRRVGRRRRAIGQVLGVPRGRLRGDVTAPARGRGRPAQCRLHRLPRDQREARGESG